jgi:hypothetical protein
MDRDFDDIKLDITMHPRIFAKLRHFDHMQATFDIDGIRWGLIKNIRKPFFTEGEIRFFLDYPPFKNGLLYQRWDYIQHNMAICDLNGLRLFREFMSLANELCERDRELHNFLQLLYSHKKSDEYVCKVLEKRKRIKIHSLFFMQKVDYFFLEEQCCKIFSSFIREVVEVVASIYILDLPYNPWKPPHYLESLVMLKKLAEEHKRRRELSHMWSEDYKFLFGTIFIKTYEKILLLCSTFFVSIEHMDYTEELMIDPLRVEVIQNSIIKWFTELCMRFNVFS